MDYSTRPRPTSTVAAVARALSKFLGLRPSKPRKLGLCDSTCTTTTAAATTNVIVDGHKSKTKLSSDPNCGVEGEDDDAKAEARRQRREAAEAVLAELFAGASAVKAAYAQLQAAQSPYDAGAIQSADQSVVAELQAISELKQGYLKGHLCRYSRESRMAAELQEVKSLVRTYELVVHKLQNQFNCKSSEVAELRAELHELSERTSLSPPPIAHFHISALNPTHFAGAVREARKSIRGFAKAVVEEMAGAGWCLPSAAASAAASLAVPAEAWADLTHQLLAFESFVSKQLFAGFQYPGFDELRRRRKSPAEYFEQFAAGVADSEFVRAKYVSVIHPRMESSLFGDLGHRTAVMSGGMLESGFFSAYTEMAKRVWLLHRLAFSFDPPASAYQVRPGSRFSQVYMEIAVDGGGEWVAADRPPVVAFTVSPGFRVGNSVVQCRVYPEGGSTRDGRSRV